MSKLQGNFGYSEMRAKEDVKVVPLPAQVPPRFVKGKVVKVDCAASPEAVLSVTAGSKLLKLHVGNRKHVVVMGADEFSCAWANQSVAVNYRETAEGTGEVVSVDVQ